MSIIDTLITNRTQADVDALLALYAKPKAMWTVDEWNEFLLGNHRGAYNASDMNRVLDALDYLAERVTEFGYAKPEIKRPSITEVIPGTSKLPEGYTELEYIRSTGEQYINTEFIPNQNSRVVAKIQFAASATTATNHIFGVRAAYKDRQFSFYGYKGVYGSTYGTADNSYSDATSLDTHFVVDKNKGVITINGETFTQSSDDFVCNASLYLFATNQGGSAYNPSSGKFYYCQIYDNDTLVRDYVPCLNPSKEVGLYDIVNGVFYGNAGTGHFMAGPVLSLPEGYTRLEYIEGDGSAYIDTGINPTNNTKIYFKVDATDGNSYAATWGGGYRFGLYVVSEGRIDIAFGSSGYLSQAITGLSFPTTITMENALLSAGGQTYSFTSQSSFTVTNTLPLFAVNNNGALTKTVGKCYFCHLYESGAPVALFTPVETAEGKIGLYDPITGEFYGNAGTGAFVAGPEIGSSDGGNTPTQTIVRDYWKIGDRPPAAELAQYLDNVSRIRSVLDLPVSVPAVPEDISQRITIEDANHIEIILTAVELLLNRIPLSWFYAGGVYSGEV